MPNVPVLIPEGFATEDQPRSKRYYFDVGIGSVCLSGAEPAEHTASWRSVSRLG